MDDCHRHTEQFVAFQACIGWAFSTELTPDTEKMRRPCFDVPTAQKVEPAATTMHSSPGSNPIVQSLPGAQLSKGLKVSMDGTLVLDWLA